MVSLTKVEKNYLRIFFKDNIEWIQNNSLLDEASLNRFIDMYGSFLEKNKLNHSRSLQMFLVVIKQEATKAKINKSSIRIQSYNVASMPVNTTLSNNPSINAWINASDYKQEETQNDEIDYYELDRRINEQRQKVLLKRQFLKTK